MPANWSLRSAVALGVATEPDLRDYYRLDPRRSQAAVASLVEEGVLEPVTVRRLARASATGTSTRGHRGGSPGGRCSARSTR